jgi:hypothetical protein
LIKIRGRIKMVRKVALEFADSRYIISQRSHELIFSWNRGG